MLQYIRMSAIKGKLYYYDSHIDDIVDGKGNGYGTRDDFYTDDSGSDQLFPFHAFDVCTYSSNEIYDITPFIEHTGQYSMLMSGVDRHGVKTQVLIYNIDLYLSIKLDDKHNTRISVMKFLEEKGCNILKSEIVEYYDSTKFKERPDKFLKIYFQSLMHRNMCLKTINNSSTGYFLNDDCTNGKWVQKALIDTKLTASDWNYIDTNLVVKKCVMSNKKYNKFNLIIIDYNIKDSIRAYNPSFVRDYDNSKLPVPPLIPIYYKMGWDIEVYGSSYVFPTVNNMQDKVFMIGGDISRSVPLSNNKYSSDIDNKVIHKWCITYKPTMYGGKMRKWLPESSKNTRNERITKSIGAFLNKDSDSESEDENEVRETEIVEDSGDWDLILCDDEGSVLQAFINLIARYNPEVRIAFNSFSFDVPFVYTRLNQLNLFESTILSIIDYPDGVYPFPVQKKLWYDKVISKDQRIKLGGDNFQDNLTIPYFFGTTEVDIMIALKRMNLNKDEYIEGHALRMYLERYKLPNKLDMDFNDMKKAYANNDYKVMYDVCDYCTIDGISCTRLDVVTDMFQSFYTLAHITFSTARECHIRAGSKRVISLIDCISKQMGINHSESLGFQNNGIDKYPGAYVYPPIRGRIGDTPVIALDYGSLYPSIMRNAWISPDTYLCNDGRSPPASELRAKGYDVFTYTYELNQCPVEVNFVRSSPNGNRVRGAIPICLEMLAAFRKHHKNEMSKNKNDEIKYKHHNLLQLAFKILMNTFYGCLGSKSARLYNVFIVSTVTMVGRDLLKLAETSAVKNNYKMLYGDTDSVFIKPPSERFVGMETKDMIKKAIEDIKPVIEEINECNYKFFGSKDEFNVLKMNLDKVLYPTFITGKKKYFANIWDDENSFSLYVSGLESIKSGKTELLKNAETECVISLLDFKFNRDIKEFILEKINEISDSITKQPIDYFKVKGKYKEEANSTIKRFIIRMRERNAQSARQMYIPNPGERFEFIVTDQRDLYTSNGTKRNLGITDMFEFPATVKRLNLPVNYKYYLKNISGPLSRMISFYPEFDPSCGTCEDDSTCSDLAKKFINNYIENLFNDKTKLNYKAIQKNKSRVDELLGAFGPFISMLKFLYNNSYNLLEPLTDIMMATENVMHQEILDNVYNFDTSVEYLVVAYGQCITNLMKGVNDIVVIYNAYLEINLFANNFKDEKEIGLKVHALSKLPSFANAVRSFIHYYAYLGILYSHTNISLIKDSINTRRQTMIYNSDTVNILDINVMFKRLNYTTETIPVLYAPGNYRFNKESYLHIQSNK